MTWHIDVGADLLVLQHHPAEGPGRIATWAKSLGLSTAVRGWSQALPESTCHHRALVVLGGPMSVNNPPARLAQERQLIRDFMHAKKPILGICLGAQLIAAELGCQIKSMHRPELGWSQVHSAAGCLYVPQWHEDEIIPNANIQVFMHSESCHTQGFTAKEHILGFQFHPEWSPDSINALSTHFSDCPIQPSNQTEHTHRRLDDFIHDTLNRWWLDTD